MAEQQQPPSHRPLGPTQQAERGGGEGGTAWRRWPEYPNPPEPGWRSGPRYLNLPDSANSDLPTLREQWRSAARRFSQWHSRAWGAAAPAGPALFAAGWAVKGSNPLPFRAGRRSQT